MNIDNLNLFGSGAVNPGAVKAETTKSNNISFEQLLHQQVGQKPEVKISAHASKRLQERNIVLAAGDMAKINRAIQQAAAKGSKDSLLIYKNTAFIASIPNRTLVTAVDSSSMTEHVFTNIDSAVFIK